MDNRQTLQTTNTRITLGAILLAIGFWALIEFSWVWWGLFIAGILSWIIAFKQEAKLPFKTPHRLWVIPLGVVGYLILGITIGYIAKLMGFYWVYNPATGHLRQLALKLPFMLMGEELLGIGILEAIRSKGFTLSISSLISALIFGLMHISAYWDGYFISTLLHVLLLQGIARLIFNYIYLKSGQSIWGSWLTHILVDFIALSL